MSPRSQKLAGVIEEVLPLIIRKFTDPDEVGFLTVTAVEVSGDLGVCDIFVRSIGTQPKFLKPLKRVMKKISGELTKKIPTRRAIILRFKEDRSINAVDKINSFEV